MSNRQKYPPYPTEDHQAMIAALDIQPHEKVLDVGGGHHPFCRADVVADIDFTSGQHRDGTRMMLDLSKHCYVQADIAALPFKDKSFDVVFCVQVLEHAADPAKACEELMRVAHRGFIETPRKWTEYYAGHPTHLWLIDDADNTLTFEAVDYDNSLFMNFALPALWSSPELLNALNIHRNIPCIQIFWKNFFYYKVYSNSNELSKETIAKRHYHFAKNLLHWMAAPEHGAYHADRAAQMMPNIAEYQNLNSFYRIISGKWKEGMSNLPLLFTAAYKLIYGIFKSVTWLNRQMMKLFVK